ncbi:hypothetical protein E2C01_074444 [Portunus trituberculatus]|uniref:Uncharacterized protein n=1 Tax=Portunus trituberculatus TaxID=210409 RepID=A0A5B7I3D2_PORTR|nr:hypothetical protein [Portunus trituberculatus]
MLIDEVHNQKEIILIKEYKEEQSYQKTQHENCNRKKRFAKVWKGRVIALAAVKFCVVATMISILCSAVIYLHNPSKKLVMRNIQDMIYPFLTSLRYITLPILERYPHLSQWYSEECLIKNAFFDQLNIDCTPCEGEILPVYTEGLKSFSSVYYNSGKLVVISDTMQNIVTIKSILQMVDINEEINSGSFQLSSGNKEVNLGTHGWSLHLDKDDIHTEWKINKLETLHLIRKVFPRVYFIPQDTEVSLHRYLFIDGPKSSPYPLPLTEFANIVLMQGEGKSLIAMIPSNHCKTTCKSIDIVLNSSQVLFFNWVYWRPVRQGGNHTSVLLMSSFY